MGKKWGKAVIMVRYSNGPVLEKKLPNSTPWILRCREEQATSKKKGSEPGNRLKSAGLGQRRCEQVALLHPPQEGSDD